MSDKNSNKISARRKLLKGLIAGSGAVVVGKSLPENWSRPVVDAVMLPAHAQTSGPTAFTGSSTVVSLPQDSHFARVVDGLINEAHAAEVILSANGICIKSDGAGTVSVDALITNTFDISDVSVTGVVVGGAAKAMGDINCLVKRLGMFGLIQDAQAGVSNFGKIEVQVSSISGNAVGKFILSGGKAEIQFNLPPGDCTAPSCPAL